MTSSLSAIFANKTPSEIVSELSIRIYESPLADLRDDLNSVPAALSVPMLLIDFDTELNMGGILCFIENSTGLYLHETINALQVIGAHETAEIMRRINQIMVSYDISTTDLREDFQGVKPGQTTSFQELHGDTACKMADEINAEADKLYLYSENGDGESLFAHLEAFIETNKAELIKSIANCAVMQGRIFFLQGRLEEAIDVLMPYSQENPNDITAMSLSADCLERLGDAETASELSQQVALLSPNTSEEFCSRGNAQMRLEKLEQAIADFSRAIELNPVNSWAIYNRATCLFRLDQFEAAIADMNTFIPLEPQNALGYFQRGTAFMRMQLSEDALRDLEKSLEIYPENFLCLVHRGQVLKGLSRIGDCIGNYSRLIELEPEHHAGYYFRADCYLDLGQNEKARVDLDRAIELNPNWPWPYCLRADASSNMADYKTAIVDYTKALELENAESEFYLRRAKAYEKANRWQEAIEDLCNYLQSETEDGEAYQIRGRCYQSLAMLELAERDLSKAKELGFGH